MSEEGTDVEPSRHEVDITVADYNTYLKAESKDGTPRLEVTVVWKFATIDTLGETGSVEEDVVHTDDNIVNNATCGNNIDKPRVLK